MRIFNYWLVATLAFFVSTGFALAGEKNRYDHLKDRPFIETCGHDALRWQVLGVFDNARKKLNDDLPNRAFLELKKLDNIILTCAERLKYGYLVSNVLLAKGNTEEAFDVLAQFQELPGLPEDEKEQIGAYIAERLVYRENPKYVRYGEPDTCSEYCQPLLLEKPDRRELEIIANKYRRLAGACYVYMDIDITGQPHIKPPICSRMKFEKPVGKVFKTLKFRPKLIDGEPVEYKNLLYRVYINMNPHGISNDD